MNRGHEPILDDIIKGVEKDGSYTYPWVMLINTVFRSHEGGKTSSQMLNEWVSQNNLKFEELRTTKGKKTETQLIFSKKR